MSNPSCYLCTTILNDSWNESNSLCIASLLLLGWFLWCASILLPHLLTISTKLPYKDHRTCLQLTSHMLSISHHITLLVINILGMDTHTHTRTRTRTPWNFGREAILWMMSWLKNSQISSNNWQPRRGRVVTHLCQAIS